MPFDVMDDELTTPEVVPCAVVPVVPCDTVALRGSVDVTNPLVVDAADVVGGALEWGVPAELVKDSAVGIAAEDTVGDATERVASSVLALIPLVLVTGLVAVGDSVTEVETVVCGDMLSVAEVGDGATVVE